MPAVDRLEEKLGVPGPDDHRRGLHQSQQHRVDGDRNIDLIAPVPEGSAKPQRYEERGIDQRFITKPFNMTGPPITTSVPQEKL